MDRLAQAVVAAMRQANLPEAVLLNAQSSPSDFGNSQVVFQLGDLLLRITRDRSQQFLDIGSTAAPDAFLQFSDVEVAMNWRLPEKGREAREPDSLENMLRTIAQHLDELRSAFGPANDAQTKALVGQIAEDRGKRFFDALRMIKNSD
jgi:hypothetical protein